MKKILLLLLFPTLLQAATTYTEFYCYPASADDSNLNSGSSTNAAKTYAGGTFVRSTGVFTVASGDPASDGVAVGEFASIYTTAGATVATFIGRVTARDATTITVSTTAISGATANVSETANAATCKVGGPWTGPAGTTQFPFNFAAATMTNANGNVMRVNLQNDQAYTLTGSGGAINHGLAGPAVFQGFSATPGDGNRATINDTTTATSYTFFTLGGSASNITVEDLILHSSFTGGTAVAVTTSNPKNIFRRVVVHDFRHWGFVIGSGGSGIIECEVYAVNKSNTASVGGVSLGAAGAFAIRCISHDNVTGNSVGFQSSTANALFIGCIADSNASDGFWINTTGANLIGCDSYNNGGDGLDLASANSTSVYVENCNFVKNTGYGINSSGTSPLRNGYILNCGFPNTGGATSNGSGNIATIEGVNVLGTVTYLNTQTPWSDPDNGDFRIVLAAAKNAGRGGYSETAASYTGTIGYPDIGSAQHQTPASAGGGSYTWAQ